jgi:hypothetical protein
MCMIKTATIYSTYKIISRLKYILTTDIITFHLCRLLTMFVSHELIKENIAEIEVVHRYSNKLESYTFKLKFKENGGRSS